MSEPNKFHMNTHGWPVGPLIARAGTPITTWPPTLAITDLRGDTLCPPASNNERRVAAVFASDYQAELHAAALALKEPNPIAYLIPASVTDQIAEWTSTAVRVMVAGAGLVGYLSQQAEDRYRPPLLVAGQAGYLVAVPCTVRADSHGLLLIELLMDAPKSFGARLAQAIATAESRWTGGPAPGWYSDPTGRFAQRHWDGVGWTEHVFDDGTQRSDPLPT